MLMCDENLIKCLKVFCSTKKTTRKNTINGLVFVNVSLLNDMNNEFHNVIIPLTIKFYTTECLVNGHAEDEEFLIGTIRC